MQNGFQGESGVGVGRLGGAGAQVSVGCSYPEPGKCHVQEMLRRWSCQDDVMAWAKKEGIVISDTQVSSLRD